MSNEYSYPFDPTGTRADNKITGEQQILTVINEKHYSRIIPRWAPFFHQGLRLRIRLPNGVVRDMVEGEDYYLGNQFRQATKATAKPIYGSINIIDRTLQGTIMLDTYQTLGGMWTIDETEITRILANQLYNPRIVTWEQVVEVPAMFPVINHEWDLVDLTGMSDVSQKLSEIAFTIANSGDSGLLTHIADDQNPHKVTKAQVGLGLVQNHGIATKAQAEAGSLNTAYMTPLRVIQAIEHRVVDLRAHLLNYENPHNTTKAQVGLGDVVNLPLANQVHAEEGQSNAHYMTPLRVKNAIDLRMGALDLHINDLTNPHQVNKTQVGLGSVENYGIATQSQATIGTSNVHYMTPLRVREAINVHADLTDNPHDVTKAQVGLGDVENYGVATQAEAQEGTSNVHYMTPLLVKEAINLHADLTDNPHKVTKAQVGLGLVQNHGIATKELAELGESNNSYMTPLRVREAVLVHEARKDNPHNVTKAQVGLDLVENFSIATSDEAKGGTSNEVYMTPLRTKDAVDVHANLTNNPHSVNKVQVGLGSVENYAIATKELAELGESNDSYMTPLRVKEAIDVLAVPLLTDHLNDFDNPHMVTATQVGAPTVGEMNAALALKLDNDATAADTTLAYGLTLNELALEVLKGTAANSLLFEGKTLQEVMTETLSGKSADSTLFNGMDIDEVMNYVAIHIGDLGTVEVVAKDTERFNGLTFEEARDLLLDGTATNASNFGGIPFADFFAHILNLLENEILLDFNVTNSNRLENLSLSEVLDLAREQISEDSKRFDGLTRDEFIDSLADVELGNARTLAGMELDDLSEELMSMVTRDYGLGYHRSFSINLGAVTTTDRWVAVGKSLFRETSPGAANRQVGVVEVEFSFKDTTNNHGSPVKYQFFVEGKSIKGYLLNDSLKDEVEVSTTLSDHLYFSQTTSELNEDDVYENTILSEVNEDTGSVVSNVILYLEISDELKSLMLNNELVVKTSTWGGVFKIDKVNGDLLSSLPIGSDTSTFGSIGISGVENTSTLPSEIILGLTDVPPHGTIPLPTLDLTEYELRAYLPLRNFESPVLMTRETTDVVFRQGRDVSQPDLEVTEAMNVSSKYLSVYIVAVRLNNNGLLSNIMDDYESSGKFEDKLADHSIITVEPDVSSRDVKIYANPGCVMRISYERTTGGLRHYAVIISDRTNNTSLGTRESATEFSNINSCRYVHISDALVGSVVTIRIYGNTALIPVGPSNGRIYKDSHEFYVSGNIKTVPHLSTLNNLKHFAFKADNDFTITNSLPATVDSLELTFANCPYFNSGNISQWDTSFVKSFEKCFYNARNFNQNLSNWVTSGAVLRPYAFDTNALAWDPANKPTFTPFSALGAAIEDLDFSDQG